MEQTRAQDLHNDLPAMCVSSFSSLFATNSAPQDGFSQIISQADRNALEHFIVAYAAQDEAFHALALSCLGASPQQALAAAKSRIETAVQCNTYRGVIDHRGCDRICHTLDEIIETARSFAAHGSDTTATLLLEYIILAGITLADKADSSTGSLSLTLNSALTLLQSCVKSLGQSTDTQKQTVLDSLLKTAQRKIFNGWLETRYALLQCAALLCSEQTAYQLYALLDTLLAEQSGTTQSFCREEDTLVRYYVLTATQGEATADAYLEAHLSYDCVREICLEQALAAQDYPRAEALCLEKIQQTTTAPVWQLQHWEESLYDIYLHTENRSEQLRQARKLVLQGNLSYYAAYKEQLVQAGVWQQEYLPFLSELRSADAVSYRKILLEENELALLMEEVHDNPALAFDYGALLCMRYPDEVFEVCVANLYTIAAQADSRKDYQKVCRLLQKLAEFGGIAEARRTAFVLHNQYPMRCAFLEELEKTTAALQA